jgi:hypothetical protein
VSARRRFARGRLHLHHPKASVRQFRGLLERISSEFIKKFDCKERSIHLVSTTYLLTKNKTRFFIED